MTGLEKIVEKIAQESTALCSEIIETASNKAEEIIANAKNSARKEAAAIVENAQKEADRRTAVAKSSAETITRTRYLETRNAILNDIISAAYEEVEKMDDAAYFDLIFNICVRNVEPGECVMYLSQRDISRLPNGFETRINERVYETTAVQISAKPKNIENGFILDYGDFEINCTLRNIFDEGMERIRDRLGEVLFA
ncbi:MAG: V-type ATP synthase subunit E [Ruminococcus sp.]|nr:V-type ATP synthase subunit E [Ruminococcus sp.]